MDFTTIHPFLEFDCIKKFFVYPESEKHKIYSSINRLSGGTLNLENKAYWYSKFNQKKISRIKTIYLSYDKKQDCIRLTLRLDIYPVSNILGFILLDKEVIKYIFSKPELYEINPSLEERLNTLKEELKNFGNTVELVKDSQGNFIAIYKGTTVSIKDILKARRFHGQGQDSWLQYINTFIITHSSIIISSILVASLILVAKPFFNQFLDGNLLNNKDLLLPLERLDTSASIKTSSPPEVFSSTDIAKPDNNIPSNNNSGNNPIIVFTILVISGLVISFLYIYK